MEENFGDGERSLSSLIQNVPGIVYRSDMSKDWTMKYLSGSCSKLTGYEPSELIDDKELAWAEIIHPDDRERVWNKIKEKLQDKEQFQVTYRINTKDGKEKWMWEQGTAVRDENGEVEALEGYISDITEKVEDRKRTKKREKKVKELYNASTELASCTTKEEVYELAIDSAEKILGFYTSALFIEEDGELQVKHSAEKSTFKKGDLRSLEDEGMMIRSFKDNEAYLVCDIEDREDMGTTQPGLRSGISIPIDRIGLLAAASKEPYHFDDFDIEMGKILASHVKEAMERIESQKDKSLILETVEEQILYLDTDLKVRWANDKASEYGKNEKGSIIGEKCHKFLKGKDEACEDCPVCESIETGEKKEGIQKDEDGKYWLIRSTPRLDEEGQVEGVVEIALDITDRRKAEEKIRKNKEKIEGLLDATSRLEKQHDIDGIYEVAMDAIENILEIDMGAIYVPEGEEYHLKAKTSGVPPQVEETRKKTEDVLHKTFKTKKPSIEDDVRTSTEADTKLEGYRSGISVPIGDFGVFQAMSKEVSHFDEEDMNMLILLSNHITEARERVKLHEKLEKSEKRYRRLFEESPISIWEEDFSELKESLDELERSGVDDFEKYFSENQKEIRDFVDKIEVKDVNKCTLDIFGADSKKEIFENFDQILRDEALDALKDELVAVAEGERTFETSDFVNYTLDGEKRYFYVKWATLGDRSDYSNVIVSLIDITNLKRTQKKLRKSERKYRAIFENSGTPMIISEEDSTISLANSEFAELSGYSIKELEGKKKWKEFISEDDIEKMMRYHEDRLKGAEEPPSRYTFKFVNRFGDTRDIFVQVGEMPDSEKEISSWMDITDYRETFDVMRESQEAFRVLLESVDQPVVLIDKDKEIMDINSSLRESFGWDDEDIIGRPLDQIFADEKETSTWKRKIEDLMSGERDEFDFEAVYDLKDGEKMTVRTLFRLVRDHDDSPSYAIGVLKSI